MTKKILTLLACLVVSGHALAVVEWTNTRQAPQDLHLKSIETLKEAMSRQGIPECGADKLYRTITQGNPDGYPSITLDNTGAVSHFFTY